MKTFEVEVKSFITVEAETLREANEYMENRYSQLETVSFYEPDGAVLHEVIGHCENSGLSIFEGDNFFVTDEKAMILSEFDEDKEDRFEINLKELLSDDILEENIMTEAERFLSDKMGTKYKREYPYETVIMLLRQYVEHYENFLRGENGKEDEELKFHLERIKQLKCEAEGLSKISNKEQGHLMALVFLRQVSNYTDKKGRRVMSETDIFEWFEKLCYLNNYTEFDTI